MQQLPAVDWRTADNLEAECKVDLYLCSLMSPDEVWTAAGGAQGNTFSCRSGWVLCSLWLAAMGCGASQAKSHIETATNTQAVQKLEVQTSEEACLASPGPAESSAASTSPASPSNLKPRAPKAPQATWTDGPRSYRKAPGRPNALRRTLGSSMCVCKFMKPQCHFFTSHL